MKASTTNRLLSFLPLVGVCFIIGCAVFAPDVYAGDGGQEFEDVWTTLKDWTQGTLGIAIVLVGVIIGVARQSLIAFAIGIAGAMGLYQAPTIIEALLTADGAEIINHYEVVSFDTTEITVR